MKKILLIFLFLFIQTVGAQTNTNTVFLLDLPEKYGKNENELAMIKGMLNKKAKIHPFLLYNTLEQLIQKGNKSASIDKLKKIKKAALEEELFYLAQKEQWKARMRAQLEQIDPIKKKSQAYLDLKLALREKPFKNGKNSWQKIVNNRYTLLDYQAEHKSPADINKMHYYMYKYLINDEWLIYNKSNDYSKYVDESINEKLVFYSLLNNMTSNSERIDYFETLETVINNWYMFKSKANTLPDKALLNILFFIAKEKKTELKRKMDYRIGYGLSMVFKNNVPIKYHLKDDMFANVKFDEKVNYIIGVIRINYFNKFKSSRPYFNYLNVAAGFGVGRSSTLYLPKENSKILKKEMRNILNITVYLEATTNLYTFNNLFIEGGGVVSLNNYQSEVYLKRKIRTNGIRGNIFIREIPVKSSKVDVSPMVGLRYNIGAHVNTQLYLTMQTFNFNINYEL